jgi:hypothetical protein
LLKRIGVDEKEAETSKWLMVKKHRLTNYDNKKGWLEVNGELEITDTGSGLHPIT